MVLKTDQMTANDARTARLLNELIEENPELVELLLRRVETVQRAGVGPCHDQDVTTFATNLVACIDGGANAIGRLRAINYELSFRVTAALW